MDLTDRAKRFFAELQDEICRGLERLEGADGARFHEDRWTYDPGRGGPAAGGGATRVLHDGRLFEKAGVNLAGVTGRLTELLASRLNVEPQEFFATGVSLVIHPQSPMVPTVHMNLRYLRLLGEGGEPREKGAEARRAWFGGGADLTPYYLFEEDARGFHRALHDACAGHPTADYPHFKKWCDDYFFNKHRGEARGVGGIFFDYLHEDLEDTFAFVQDAGKAFLGAYAPIVERRRDIEWSASQREWQLIRRGRYVEFNLIHDRGTLFGLETGGRTESILMSLPPLVRWVYDHRPADGSAEAELLSVLREPREWV